MEDEWAEVKSKKKKAPPKQDQQIKGGLGTGAQGGKTGKKGMLMPGAVRPAGGKYSGNSGFGGGSAAAANNYDDFDYERKMMPTNAASAVADYDFGVDDESEIGAKAVEMISYQCAQSVKHARINGDLTQAQLAKKINEKTSVIVEIENGTCKYSAQLINRIEKAIPGAKIDRGRKKKK